MHIMPDSEIQPAAPGDTPGRQAAGDKAYLNRLGERVRELRAKRGMTRKILARDSGVSERYLAQLESGQGNISIVLLRQLALALDTPIETLVFDGVEPTVEFSRAVELLRRLPPADAERAHRVLIDTFGGAERDSRRRRVALIGLRGAGKSTLGKLVADRIGVPFVELDKEIERECGMPLSTLFDLYGQPAFRRLERRCLDRLIDDHRAIIIATGGSIVSEPATFERLLASCYTVWIKASPASHMQRVVAQGDMRPMSNNREAMADLQQILKVRDALYRRADGELDTTTASVDESADCLLQLIEAEPHE